MASDLNKSYESQSDVDFCQHTEVFFGVVNYERLLISDEQSPPISVSLLRSNDSLLCKKGKSLGDVIKFDST
jgi:hypothetical protein